MRAPDGCGMEEIDMILKKCINCGKEITPKDFTTVQIYCSQKCCDEFRKRPDRVDKLAKIAKENEIEFTCAQCGRRIVISSSNDKRTRFCCRECEKKYWKHPHYDHPTSKTNFHSVQEYLSWEKRTNE